MPHESTLQSLMVLNEAYMFSLRSGASEVEQPSEIKLPLRPHQKAILYEMEQREQKLSRGMDMSGARIYSRFSFLGDGVGVGKSLMVLGHIARLKTKPTIPSIPKLTENSSSQMYCLQESSFGTDLSEVGCLVIVPHTLYNQWQGYIKDQTNLKCLGIKTKKILSDTNLMTKLRESDLTLVSNTLYGQLAEVAREHRVLWKRVFIDEADTIHIPSTRIRPDTRFTWLISASWSNLLFPNTNLYIPHTMIQNSLQWRNLDPAMRQFLLKVRSEANTSYAYLRYYTLSAHFLHDFLSVCNLYRGRLVLRCADEFVMESITLPPISIRNILCKPSVLHQVVAGAIPVEVRNLLHAGDIQGALEHLGVKAEEPMSLVTAVTENRLKELDRLRKTLEFKSSLEYSSAQAKEQSLKSLKDKIQSLEQQIQGLKERIENYKDEMCPICFDEPQEPTLTACCSRIFCAGCILASLTRTSTCPLCRANIQAAALRKLATQPLPAKNEIVDPNAPPEPLKKTEQILNLLKSHPNGKFLVFSRHDNPFIQLSEEIEALKINVKQVRGNKDVIASTLKSFQKGDTRVLLLNSIQAGAGLNITAATHVILLHAMTHEEEKQILGRAYRLGRSDPLDVIRLLHPDEMAHAQQ